MSIILGHRNKINSSKSTSEGKSRYRQMCKDAAWRIRWDYNGWRNLGAGSPYTQRDWNQTLLTKINQISAQIHQATLRGGANVIIVSPQIMPLIKDLEYYKAKDASIGSRYRVKVDDGIHPMEVLVYYDAPDPLKNVILGELGLVNDSSYFGVIRVDGIMGYNAEEQLSSMLSEQIANDIDKEVINGLTNIGKSNRRLLLLKNLAI